MSVPTYKELQLLSDEALVAQYRAGVSEAFDVLVYRYERELFNYLRRYLGDSTLAEDVFQNTFLQFHQRLELYDAGRPVRPWLYTIATNQAIDTLRKNGRHDQVSLDANPGYDEEAGTFAELIEGKATEPLEALIGAERRQWVRNAVSSLPERLRLVLILAYYQGLSYREIAEVLSVPVGTVKSRLHTAVSRLAELWRQSEVVMEQ